jgi:hypothetical protein
VAAGVADRLWSVEDLAAVGETYEQRGVPRRVITLLGGDDSK